MQPTIHHIKLGPSHLEEVLYAQAPRVSSDDDKRVLYKDLIGTIPDNDTLISNFCLAWLHQRAAEYASDDAEARPLLNSALTYYQHILRKGRRKGEEYFYAHLMSGAILYALGEDWEKIEEIFLLAYEINPRRGEPIARIIRHYLSIQNWPVAYIFTSFARDQFFGQPPLQDKWGVDKDFYAWKVLDFHTAAAFSIGKMDEATETFAHLCRLTVEQPQLFPPGQIDRIEEKKQFFQN